MTNVVNLPLASHSLLGARRPVIITTSIFAMKPPKLHRPRDILHERTGTCVQFYGPGSLKYWDSLSIQS